jgi:hypothetical protein
MSNENARRHLMEIQRAAHAHLGMPPFDYPPTTAEYNERYLATNPDYSGVERRSRARTMTQPDDDLSLRPDMSAQSGSGRLLAERLDDLRAALGRSGLDVELGDVCFGTVPGGGLDAYSARVPGHDEYVVVVPEGYFYLVNLFTKLVVLLQPLEAHRRRVDYPPNAAFDQLQRARHPYVVMRARDVVRAFFVHGNPVAALPYRQAVAYQDRFTYLLIGTELYLLAHELGHVHLGHLDSERGDETPVRPPRREAEIEADRFALTVVTAFFGDDPFAVARASLCGYLFHQLVSVWEQTVRQVVPAGEFDERERTHPPAKDRLEDFTSIVVAGEAPAPPWYPYVQTGILLATEVVPWAALEDIAAEAACGAETQVHARALPAGFAHLGRFAEEEAPYHWAGTIAELLTSTDADEQGLGLWLHLGDPSYGEMLLRGLVDEDAGRADLCAAALVSVDPEYETQIPALRERLRMAEQEGRLDSYVEVLAGMEWTMAVDRVGADWLATDPLHQGFFTGEPGAPMSSGRRWRPRRPRFHRRR